MVITGALALGACQEDSVLDEVQNTELNEEAKPDEKEHHDPPT